jgi:hypothetical protein
VQASRWVSHKLPKKHKLFTHQKLNGFSIFKEAGLAAFQDFTDFSYQELVWINVVELAVWINMTPIVIHSKILRNLTIFTMGDEMDAPQYGVNAPK